jgi:hypothetical protein
MTRNGSLDFWTAAAVVAVISAAGLALTLLALVVA